MKCKTSIGANCDEKIFNFFGFVIGLVCLGLIINTVVILSLGRSCLLVLGRLVQPKLYLGLRCLNNVQSMCDYSTFCNLNKRFLLRMFVCTVYAPVYITAQIRVACSVAYETNKDCVPVKTSVFLQIVF